MEVLMQQLSDPAFLEQLDSKVDIPEEMKTKIANFKSHVQLMPECDLKARMNGFISVNSNALLIGGLMLFKNTVTNFGTVPFCRQSILSCIIRSLSETMNQGQLNTFLADNSAYLKLFIDYIEYFGTILESMNNGQ